MKTLEGTLRMLYALENLHREAVSASQRKPLNYKLKFHLKSADVQAFCVWVWFGTWLHSGGGTCPLQVASLPLEPPSGMEMCGGGFLPSLTLALPPSVITFSTLTDSALGY